MVQKDSTSDTALIASPDFSYLLLENRFRGGEEAIKKALSFYPDFFKKAAKPILEIGPGRGELLELFKEKGLQAYGVDIDGPMVTVSIGTPSSSAMTRRPLSICSPAAAASALSP